MKRSIILLPFICGLMTTCTAGSEKQHEGSKFPIELDKNPITDLLYDLEKNGEGGITWNFEGGEYLKSKVTYYTYYDTHFYEKPGRVQSLSEKKRTEMERIRNAFDRASEEGIKSYHTEQHLNGIDTVLYAVALKELSGEKSSLRNDFESNNIKYYNLQYDAAQVATLRFNSSPSIYDLHVEYVTKIPTGKPRKPFTLKYLKDELEKYVKMDSVKTYNVHYKYTDEEIRRSDSMRVQSIAEHWGERRQNLETRTWDGETRGHLYVVSPSLANLVGNGMKQKVMNYCMGIQANESYDLNMYGNLSDSDGKESGPINWGLSVRSRAYRWDEPYEVMHITYHPFDSRLFILVIDQIDGAYALPGNWEYCISAVDGKRTYIPGTPESMTR